MSDTPKYSSAQLTAAKQEALRRERERKAAEEASCRRSAEREYLERRFQLLRTESVARVRTIQTRVQGSRASLYAQDSTQLSSACSHLVDSILQATNERAVTSAIDNAEALVRDLERALGRKRRDDQEAERRQEIEILHSELLELQQRLLSTDSTDTFKFDRAGADAARLALESTRRSVAIGELTAARTAVAGLRKVVDQHLGVVARLRKEWLRRSVVAKRNIDEITALIAGLESDPTLVRWVSAAISQLKRVELEKAQDALAAERFEYPGEILKTVQLKSIELTSLANEAQLKADQQDYFMNSIKECLTSLGFVPGLVSRQIPGHPKSALQLAAAKGSGRRIDVCVPVEGPILYSVNGYPKSTVSIPGGVTAKVCDEAEAALNEMRAKLLAEFGVETSEVGWVGKPKASDTLMSRQSLPKSESTKR